MNINAARSELHSPPRIKLSGLIYEMLAVFLVSVGLVLFLS